MNILGTIKSMITLEKVKDGIYKYGYYPALMFLKEKQEQECFEDCKIIKEALDSVGEGRDWYLSTDLNKKTLDRTYNNIVNGRDLINKNMPRYIEKFRELMLTK